MKLWVIMSPSYILNLYSGYSMFHENDPLHYKSNLRLFLKKQCGLNGWTVDHHIFPKCLSRHPVLHGMNINCGKNLKIMPNKRANVSSIILKHKEHPAYNRYVKSHLDKIYFDIDEENRRYQLYLLLHDLEQKLNFGELPF
jgi:hypothetical protein